MSAVELVPYSAAWPAAFQAIEGELRAAFAPARVAIEHIGSTAVDGLVAKPVIDVLLGAGSLEAVEQRIDALAALGYAYRPACEQQIPERRYFVRSRAGELRVHLHAVVQDAPLWRSHLAFRDALREDPALRAAYQTLKRRLASEHADDKARYTAAKAPFVQRVLAGRRGDAD